MDKKEFEITHKRMEKAKSIKTEIKLLDNLRKKVAESRTAYICFNQGLDDRFYIAETHEDMISGGFNPIELASLLKNVLINELSNKISKLEHEFQKI